MDWGVEKEKITELNWWDEIDFQGLTVALTPSKHFSGRGLLNRNSTLWGAFTLAFHRFSEPIERALIASEKSGVSLIAPKIGETVILNGEYSMLSSVWWE